MKDSKATRRTKSSSSSSSSPNSHSTLRSFCRFSQLSRETNKTNNLTQHTHTHTHTHTSPSLSLSSQTLPCTQPHHHAREQGPVTRRSRHATNHPTTRTLSSPSPPPPSHCFLTPHTRTHAKHTHAHTDKTGRTTTTSSSSSFVRHSPFSLFLFRNKGNKMETALRAFSFSLSLHFGAINHTNLVHKGGGSDDFSLTRLCHTLTSMRKKKKKVAVVLLLGVGGVSLLRGVAEM